MALPTFFNEDGAQIITDMTADLESRLNRVINPADVEMLLINAVAYREQLLRVQANDAARQCLVSFATGSSLDYLAVLVGVTRLTAVGAQCTMQFNIVQGHTGVYLPIGIRVQSVDGKVIFITTQEANVPVGTYIAVVKATCSTLGEIGNGFAIGAVQVLLDPQPFVTSVANTDVSNGGFDDESDDDLRIRIELAPSTYSVAGPIGAYKYFAKSANADIVDVAIKSLNPGEVQIYPLMVGGQLPGAEVLSDVLNICSDLKVRPLTDTVYALAPTVYPYDINVQLVVFSGAVNADVINNLTTILNNYKTTTQNQMGVDVIVKRIESLCMIPGQVYNCTLVSPSVDYVADDNIYTQLNNITITITGSANG